MKFLLGLACAALLAISPAAHAGGHITWNLLPDESRVAFSSVKSNITGEVHHFNKLAGTVKENGDLAITIDLSSVETNIDIRNERMTKHVFQEGKATAVISGSIDMAEVNSLKVGETKVVEIEAKLTFAGVENDLDARMLVARLSEDRVLVSTEDFLMISTEDLGIDKGIDALMALAKLPGITRVTAVSLRSVFQK